MSKYYYLIAGLPNIAFDDGKLPYTVLGFKEELLYYLKKKDCRLLDILLLRIDNRNLLKQLQHPGFDFEQGGKVSRDEIAELLDGVRNERDDEKPFRNRNKNIPHYFEELVRMYEQADDETRTHLPWIDILGSQYFSYGLNIENRFVSAWFTLNLDINNILTAMTCRKYKLERANFIIGNTETAEKLRTSNARDFDLGDTLELLPAVMKISDEPDLYLRERRKDRLRWDWLEEQTFACIFDVESVLAYFLKLEIMERWNSLDKAEGERAFRQLAGNMKRGSDNALKEFERNNKK
ncbi:MAG: DUF2764 domain-containing protein [Tannerellaceae bacterium]|jgi:hypothetical protein|nr:DUF2764 domain-containing protein [Tannerellaceae bacterium]